MSSNDQWMQRDLAVLWHPCTQMKDHEKLPLVPIRRAEGIWLEDFDGNRYLDAVSSWWTNIFGHCNPRINDRIKQQLDQLEHVMLAGFSHAPVIELSERLVAMTPQGLDRVFYADNGSSGIEVALKMSHHYWLNHDQPQKKRFATITNGYHGETLGTLAVGDVALFTETYKALLMDCIKVPSPDCYHRPEGVSWEEHSRLMFELMRQTLAEHHQELAAVILEPLVQGAGGMRMYHPIYLTLLREDGGWLVGGDDQVGLDQLLDRLLVGLLLLVQRAHVGHDEAGAQHGLLDGVPNPVLRVVKLDSHPATGLEHAKDLAEGCGHQLLVIAKGPGSSLVHDRFRLPVGQHP